MDIKYSMVGGLEFINPVYNGGNFITEAKSRNFNDQIYIYVELNFNNLWSNIFVKVTSEQHLKHTLHAY